MGQNWIRCAGWMVVDGLKARSLMDFHVMITVAESMLQLLLAMVCVICFNQLYYCNYLQLLQVLFFSFSIIWD